MTRLGIIGGGQLGRMLGEAGQRLGVRARFLEPAASPSAGIVGEVVAADYADPEGLRRISEGAAAITYEFENVPRAAVDQLLARGVEVYPGPVALETAQDRLVEKRFFRSQGVGTAPFHPVSGEADLEPAIRAVGLPAILKTRREGYDGKGQRRVEERAQLQTAFEALGRVPCVLEGVVPFDRELSVLAVRDQRGEVRVWPIVENHHHRGILWWSRAPAPELSVSVERAAGEIARHLLQALEYVGVVAVELFQVGTELLANEMAPRVHNSGHWTIEGAATSQFENHLRAVLGWPLGSTELLVPCGCVNLLHEVPELDALLAVPGARVHLYDKAPRPGRKLGHVTVVGGEPVSVAERLASVRALARA